MILEITYKPSTSVAGKNDERDIKTVLVSITLTSTPTLSATNTPSPTAEKTSTPKPTSTPSQTSAKTLQAVSVSENLLKKVNEYRNSKGLSSVTTDGYTCAFATTRANEIVENFNHDGFRNRIDSKNLPYPSYSHITENIAMNSNPDQVIQGWIDSPGHRENMEKNTPYACIANSGNYYTYEGWRP